jgi:hypothetical protein
MCLPEELDREDAARRGGGYGEFLLYTEDGEEDGGEDEADDDLAATPGVEDAAKGDGHDAGGEGAGEEETADRVHFFPASEVGGIGLGVVDWEQEEENEGEKAANANDQRQPAKLCVNVPSIIGPKTVPIPHMSLVQPMYIGRSRIVVVIERRVMTPTYMPKPLT